MSVRCDAHDDLPYLKKAFEVDTALEIHEVFALVIERDLILLVFTVKLSKERPNDVVVLSLFLYLSRLLFSSSW